MYANKHWIWSFNSVYNFVHYYKHKSVSFFEGARFLNLNKTHFLIY